MWFVVGYAFYASLFACAGALVPRQEELQSVTTPLTLILLISFFVSFAVLDNPDGTLAARDVVHPDDGADHHAGADRARGGVAGRDRRARSWSRSAAAARADPAGRADLLAAPCCGPAAP